MKRNQSIDSTNPQNKLSNINFNVIEYKDFEVFISNSPSTRYCFPSLLTYTDLEKVFLRKEEIKNKGYIKSAQDTINKFVSTEHYMEAARRISENNILMLVGNPKSGKTSIVEALALYFLTEEHFKPYFIRNTDEFFTISSYLPADEEALFICDDIFGKHELDSSKLQEWTDYFQSVMGLVDSNRKFLFTTRQYIYEEFANKSGLRVLFPNENDPTRYIVKLSKLTDDEREQILDKHLSKSNLSEDVINLALVQKQEILECKDFSPEVVRSMVVLISNAEPQKVPEIISRHISEPNQYLYEFFNNINVQKRLLLLSVAVAVTTDSSDVENSFLTLMKDSKEQPQVIFETFIDEINGSIVRRRDYLGLSEIEYYHPSMYDVIISIFKKDGYYRQMLLRNTNLELLYLLTFLKVEDQSTRMQISASEVTLLTEGITRLLSSERKLFNIARILQWINVINSEIPYNPAANAPLNSLKRETAQKLSSNDFFIKHKSESLEYWINVLDKWNLITYKETIQYKKDIELANRNYSTYDYWRLVFLLESTEAGFIKQNIPPNIFKKFEQELTKVVNGLRLGLNIIDGRPKTRESWYPLFLEVNDLITKMKKSGLGKQIIESNLLADWNQIKQFSEFTKNRHAGSIKSGYWKPYKPLRNFYLLSQNLR